jgi:trehalose synthase-fused probable maltokinase
MTELSEFLPQQRWFADKSQEISEVVLLDSLTLETGGELQLIGIVFGTGARAIYQLVPELGGGLAEAMAAGADLETAQGCFAFRSVDGLSFDHPALRPIGAEQSNTTVVVNDAYAMKVFRKLEAGINPELEMLRFLSARDYPNIAPLRGWYEYEGPTVAATLGVLQEYIPDGRDGWQLALEEIPTDAARFVERAGSLGAATAHLHSTLATDHDDPAFAPNEPSSESMALLRAKIDEDIEQMFLTLPDLASLAPISARCADVRGRLADRPLITALGRFIRIHGDYHLGQTLARPDGSWILLDFEGEPARPLSERRMKRSALRDVASMLRSFAYAAAAAQRAGSAVPPEFELDARTAFLESYFAEVDQSLLPAGEPAVQNLLGIFELEKAIYELRYELNNRPDWVAIPVAGIEALLEAA